MMMCLCVPFKFASKAHLRLIVCQAAFVVQARVMSIRSDGMNMNAQFAPRMCVRSPCPARYLPLTMEAEFQSHLGDVLPLILDGLSDEARAKDRQTDSSSSSRRPLLVVQCVLLFITCSHCQPHQQAFVS
jgi:hypothetical protein